MTELSNYVTIAPDWKQTILYLIKSHLNQCLVYYLHSLFFVHSSQLPLECSIYRLSRLGLTG